MKEEGGGSSILVRARGSTRKQHERHNSATQMPLQGATVPNSNTALHHPWAHVRPPFNLSHSAPWLLASSLSLWVLCLCPTLCDPMDYGPPGSSVHADSPGKDTGVGCHALLQGIFPTQGLNPGLPHCRRILYHLSHQGSPFSV